MVDRAKSYLFGQPLNDCPWIDEAKLRRQGEDLFRVFRRLSEASSFSYSGGIDVAEGNTLFSYSF